MCLWCTPIKEPGGDTLSLCLPSSSFERIKFFKFSIFRGVEVSAHDVNVSRQQVSADDVNILNCGDGPVPVVHFGIILWFGV